MNRSKAAVRALVLAAALVLPLGLAMPASAATSRDGCTVDPVRPIHNGTFTAGGEKWIDYDVEVDCSAGRTIELEMQRWEADSGLNGADDLIGTSSTTRTFNTTSGWTWTITGVLPDNDGGIDQWSEMYQRVRFRVTSNGVQGSWTAWESSGIRDIHV
ncbi:hypothetical protein ACFQY4_16445 [Catellatospora bangladeshensis]|uniref:Secreted protein n=1 Tax=Catellatospora bangladeshensis TaxID=310355 RepID=A0A8J3JPW6_9ACTN|nr:hypothetical protein [Catellatospora bangladeshensis]GIF86399.1 hypothetical protein Cba03nite_77480 [Catellatospora bangladeshensis]